MKQESSICSKFRINSISSWQKQIKALRLKFLHNSHLSRKRRFKIRKKCNFSLKILTTWHKSNKCKDKSKYNSCKINKYLIISLIKIIFLRDNQAKATLINPANLTLTICESLMAQKYQHSSYKCKIKIPPKISMLWLKFNSLYKWFSKINSTMLCHFNKIKSPL